MRLSKVFDALYRLRGLLMLGWVLWVIWPMPIAFHGSFFVLMGLAILIRIWARTTMGVHSRGSELQAPTLVTQGLYAWIAHPLYVSNAMMAMALLSISGWSMVWQGIWMLVLLVFYWILAKAENSYLQQCFGEQWIQWNQGRSFKKIFPLPSLAQCGTALWSDRWTWLWLVALLMGMALRRGYGL